MAVPSAAMAAVVGNGALKVGDVPLGGGRQSASLGWLCGVAAAFLVGTVWGVGRSLPPGSAHLLPDREAGAAAARERRAPPTAAVVHCSGGWDLAAGAGALFKKMAAEKPGAAEELSGDVALVKQVVDRGLVDNEIRVEALRCMYNQPSRFGRAVLLGAVLGLVTFAGPLVAIKLLGFTATGVAKGSVAALIQSTFPLIPAGSWFAWLQSLAMTKGALLGLSAKLAAVSAALPVAVPPWSTTKVEALGDGELLSAVASRGAVSEALRAMLVAKLEEAEPSRSRL